MQYYPTMASSLFSLSSSSISTRTSLVFNHSSSPFKGNTKNLKSNQCSFPSIIKFQSKIKLGTRPVIVLSRASALPTAIDAASPVRFRLDNLGPQPGAKKNRKRKGRGVAAGQGGSCGFGMRGQKSRSGPGVRRGFEGGQMPLYRRIPKLRGIAGGMHAGLPKYIPVNLKDIADAGFEEGEEVSLETLKDKGLINPSGRDRKLPLKILGDGDISVKLNFKARAFSSSAKEKLEAASCSLTLLPGRKKWVKPSVAKNIARADEYFAKKRADAAAAAASSST
ncbi:50S ribosomal protein L15, chloroplastic [Impatiens glandulifera]|uniref:50S ribosomal protein L15, chloroplastic n=1 Tax=Impatiens glandulifera TaxID=253017 RepID=UPI001FB171DD|nr:50S ribosomal protein L15, chloroplastic [Impatiens glandulifera]